MVGAHLGLEEVGLRNHPVYVDLHNFLHEGLVVQRPSLRVLVEQHLRLVVLEVAPELVQAPLEVLKADEPSICEVEIGEGLLARLPLVGLAVALQPDLLVEGVLYFPEASLAHMLFRLLQVPRCDYQLLEILHRETLTVCLSLGIQKFSSA